MTITLCTFNANNLYARYKFGRRFPGDRSTKSLVEDERTGYLPLYNAGMLDLFNAEQRELSSRALSRDGLGLPDIVCVQEVESLLALRTFNQEYLGGHYPYCLLVDSWDFRQIDVGLLSTREILGARTHVDELDPEATNPKRPWLFSRDCLEVELALNEAGTKRLTLFVNHLKSKYAETPEQRKRGDQLRTRQATRVAKIVHERFPGQAFQTEWFAVVGDLNDQPASPCVAPLTQNAGLVDALGRIPAESGRWTYWWRSPNDVSQIDHLLLSPALHSATQGVTPQIERRGIGFSRYLQDGTTGPRKTEFYRQEEDPSPVSIPFQFARFDKVNTKLYASDHCPVFLEIPV